MPAFLHSKVSHPKLGIAVAVARNGVIGRDGGLPWSIRSDLRRFKRLTWGSVLIMGRRTWEEVGTPLPGRRTIVVSSSRPAVPEAVLVVRSFDEALALAGSGAVFCVGGAQLYAEALPRARDLHLTQVEAEVAGDVVFPPVDWSRWLLVMEERGPAGAADQFATTYRWYRQP